MTQLYMDTEAVRALAEQMNRAVDEMMQELARMDAVIAQADWESPSRDQFMESIRSGPTYTWYLQSGKKFAELLLGEANEWDEVAARFMQKYYTGAMLPDDIKIIPLDPTEKFRS